MNYKIDVSYEDFENIITGQQTFLHGERGKYHVNDKLTLCEKRGRVFTGRSCVCKVTDVYSGPFCTSLVSVLSFRLLFPEETAMIPISVFMELHKMYSAARSECELLKENKK